MKKLSKLRSKKAQERAEKFEIIALRCGISACGRDFFLLMAINYKSTSLVLMTAPWRHRPGGGKSDIHSSTHLYSTTVQRFPTERAPGTASSQFIGLSLVGWVVLNKCSWCRALAVQRDVTLFFAFSFPSQSCLQVR